MYTEKSIKDLDKYLKRINTRLKKVGSIRLKIKSCEKLQFKKARYFEEYTFVGDINTILERLSLSRINVSYMSIENNTNNQITLGENLFNVKFIIIDPKRIKVNLHGSFLILCNSHHFLKEPLADIFEYMISDGNKEFVIRHGRKSVTFMKDNKINNLLLEF